MINEDQMFRMLLAGKTLAEAAWSSALQLSWVNTVVGDPLMTWKQLLPGDANMDGRVDSLDLTLLSANWGKSVPGGGNGWAEGDLNGDGVVDMADLAILSADWGQVATWAGGSATTAGVTSADGSTFDNSSTALIPEPSSCILLAIGTGVALGYRWRKRARRPSNS